MELTDFQHKTDIPPLSEDRQQAFFEEVLGRALEAERAAGTVVHDIDLAGARVRLAFAGESIAHAVMPALSHLRLAEPGEPEALLHIFDTASTGVSMVPPPCPREWLTDRGDIWGMSSERFRSAFHWIESSVNLFDRKRKEGVYWVSSVGALPYWTRSSPFRTLFHWWLEQNGGVLLHAAAVGTEDGALLITGKGGVGKSSTALACLAAGLKYVADDYLAVRLDPEPRVYSLYSTAKLNAEQVERFPTLRALVTNELSMADEKAVIHLVPGFAAQVVRSLPLRAIATPRFTHGPATSFGPASAAALRRAASFTTMSQLPHAGHQMHRFLERMVATLPGVELQLGNELGGIPRAIAEFLGSSQPETVGRHSATAASPQPLVTVVIPVHNGGRFLEEAVRNILSQQYAALEIIIVDDGSTEDIGAVVDRLPVDVRFFRQENSGPAAARNRGVRDASGEFIAFLDADDLWPAGNLEEMVRRLRGDPEADVVHGLGQPTRYSPTESPGEYLGDPRDAFPFYIGAGLYRRRVFQSVGLFDSTMRFGEDHDWFLRARELGARIVHLDDVTLFVRRHDGNMTRGKSLVELNALRVFKKMLDRKRGQAAPG